MPELIIYRTKSSIQPCPRFTIVVHRGLSCVLLYDSLKAENYYHDGEDKEKNRPHWMMRDSGLDT